MKMRTDFMMDRKTIHVGLKKEIYLEFKKKLFDMNITMQAALEEFCKLVVEEHPPASKMLERIALAVVKGEITKYYQKKNDPMDKLDHDALYNLIEKELNEKNSDTNVD